VSFTITKTAVKTATINPLVTSTPLILNNSEKVII